MSKPARPSQILFLSQPRTGCHLLERMLTARQHGLQICWHPFVAARPAQVASLTEGSVASGIPGKFRRDFAEKVQDGVVTWQKALKETEATDMTLFLHSHPHFALDPDQALHYVKSDWRTPTASAKSENYTLIPDSLLLHPGTIPLMTFRHPASTAAAAYTAMTQLEHSGTLSNFLVARHLGWIREMYDWYVVHGITPILAEAEDYMSSPEFVKHLAEKAGLDPELCLFKWEKATEEEMKDMLPMYVKLQQTLLGSTGIVEGKARRTASIEEEAAKWREQFDEEAAALIEAAARAAMPDYEYLITKKARLSAE